MDYIYLEIKTDEGWQGVNLPSDISISVEETSPLWNTDNDGTFTYPFQIDMDDNPHIFKTSADGHGESVYSRIQNHKFRLYVGGAMFKYGIVKLEDSIELSIDDSTHHRMIDISLEADRGDLDSILDGVKIQDLNLSQYKIQIGYCLPDELPVSGTYRVKKFGMKAYKNGAYEKYTMNEAVELLTSNVSNQGDLFGEKSSYTETWNNTITMPKVMIPHYYDTIYNTYNANFVNVLKPYNPLAPYEYPFCNTRACYQRYVWDDDNDQWKTERGTSVGEPDRVNSAPCFYFGFIHDELFKQLKIHINRNALNNIIDYKRLAFWNTKCEYDIEKIEGKNFDISNENNKIKLYAEYASGRQYSLKRYITRNDAYEDLYRTYHLDKVLTTQYPLCKAYANADNLPDLDAKDLIEATTTAFGARYIYEPLNGELNIYLIRDILGSNSTVTLDNLLVTGDIIKTENDVRGLRFRYSSSSDTSKNSITKEEILVSGDDDTTFTYNDYRYPYVIGYGNAKYENGQLSYSYGSQTPIRDYADMITSVTSFDLHLYIDPVTGNAYRIKVDGDATTQAEWYPSVFQVAGYRDVVLGDVSDDEYVEEISIPFTPIIPNDVNFYNQYKARKDFGVINDNGETKLDIEIPNPIYAQLVDGEIHHNDDNALIKRKYHYQAVTCAEVYDVVSKKTSVSCHIDINLIVFSVEDYEATNGSDGPYFDNEPSFALGIMRGSGSSENTLVFNENYDGEGHSMYVENAGTSAEFTSDCMDAYGNMYDYKGGETHIESVKYSEVENYIFTYFLGSNADLLSPNRKLNKTQMAASGWTIPDVEFITVNAKIYELTNVTDGKNYYYIFASIEDNGSVYTEYGLDAYVQDIHSESMANNQNLQNVDMSRDKCLVGAAKSLAEANALVKMLKQLHAIYYGNLESGDVEFPGNSGYTTDDLISLKLKTEIPINGDPANGYYPITNTLAKNRGLADKFYGSYFHWLLNRKIATIPCTIPDANMKDIDWFTRYDINGYKGFINKKSYSITQNGISGLKLQMYYL